MGSKANAKVWGSSAAAVVILGLGWTALAQDPTSTGEKIKAKVGGAVDTIKKGAVNAEEAIKERFSRAKSAVVGMGIEARVYARLHWERQLIGSKIDLSAPKDGIIIMNGSVADEKARARAVDLAASTVGVTEVIDHLTVLTVAVPARP